MTEVSPEIYEQQFERIFQFFHDNCHVAPEEYDYLTVKLPNTHYQMVDIVDKRNNKVSFRVLLKATYDDVDTMSTPRKNYKDLDILTNTKSSATLSDLTAIQVYYCELDKKSKPIHGKLWTYSPHDESYHGFSIERRTKEDDTTRSPDGEKIK